MTRTYDAASEPTVFATPRPVPIADDLYGCVTLRDLLRAGQQMLTKCGIENAAQEAQWLLQTGLGVSRVTLHVDGTRILTREDRERVVAFLRRRANSEPLQYILGTQEFCGLEFIVTPAVLIPRTETEMLVKEAVKFAEGRRVHVMADIGTGSGCIAVTLAKQLPSARVYATDVSGAALTIARANAVRQSVADRVQFLEGDLLAPLRLLELAGRISILVSNPPYIPDKELNQLQPEVSRYEPRTALAGGHDGLAFHRRLVREAPVFLESGGLLILEVGHVQAEAVSNLASSMSLYCDIQVLKDEAGLPRVVRLERS